MQTGIRQTRSTPSTGRFRIFEAPRLSRINIVIPLFSLLFSSCALWTHKKLEGKDISKKLTKFCLVGEGRGRVRAGLERQIFGYEAAFETPQKWSLGVDLPLYGQEVLNIHFPKDTQSSEFQVSGSFWPRLKRQTTAMKDSRDLKLFLRAMAILVKISRLAKDGALQCDEKGNCHMGSEIFKVYAEQSDKIILQYQVTGNKTVRVELSDEAEIFFQRINLTISYLENDKQRPFPYSLDLFQRDCYQ